MEKINKKMRYRCTNIWLFIRSVDAVYHWLGVGSLAILLAKVLVLNSIPAPLRFMSAVSPVVEGVLGSVIASYIFYLFCVHPQTFKERKTSAAFVNQILTRIKKSFESHIKSISDTLNDDSTEADFEAVFTKLDPFTEAPLIIDVSSMAKADWFGFFLDNNVHLETNISRLMDSRLYIDIETINILTRISNCLWFSHIRRLMNHKHMFTPTINYFVSQKPPEMSVCRELYVLKELIRSLQPAIDATEKFKDRV